MTLQIPVRRVQRLPDAAQIGTPANACRTVQLQLRLGNADGAHDRDRGRECSNPSMSHEFTPLDCSCASSPGAVPRGGLLERPRGAGTRSPDASRSMALPSVTVKFASSRPVDPRVDARRIFTRRSPGGRAKTDSKAGNLPHSHSQRL